jgi:hypothetical protein
MDIEENVSGFIFLQKKEKIVKDRVLDGCWKIIPIPLRIHLQNGCIKTIFLKIAL